MHIVTHLVERDVQAVLRIAAVHHAFVQHQDRTRHAQSAYLLIINARVCLRKNSQTARQKGKYECGFSHFRLQNYKKYAKVQNIFAEKFAYMKKLLYLCTRF
jgi:hypothetical protein